MHNSFIININSKTKTTLRAALTLTRAMSILALVFLLTLLINLGTASTVNAYPIQTIITPTNATSITLPTLPTASPVTFATSLAGGAVLSHLELLITTGITPNTQTSTTRIGVINATSNTYDWQPIAAGTYTLVARAVDTNGNAGLSTPITVTIVTPVGETITYLHTDLMGNTIMASDAQGAKLCTQLHFNFEVLEFTY